MEKIGRGVFVKGVWFVLALLSFAGTADAKELESLLGRGFGVHSLYIQVRSGGCTHRSDFKIEKQKQGRVYDLAFERVAPDPCYANFPAGTWLEFGYAELGLTPGDEIKIKNPEANFSIPQASF